MRQIDGAAVRALVETLPPHVFDDLMFDMPELLEGLTEEAVRKYIRFVETNEDYTPDDVAKDYQYNDIEDMYESGPYVVVFDEGVLVIE